MRVIIILAMGCTRDSKDVWLRALTAGCLMAGALAALGVGAAQAPSAAASKILAVGAENEYADVIGQIGGRYVSASAVMSNPNTDPHTFESSPQVAQTVSSAQLIVQNGLGYDDFMTKIENASPNSQRKTIDVQLLLRLPDSTPNPHLWYKPTTMPVVARAIGNALSSLDPVHRTYYRTRVGAFVASLAAWNQAIAHLKATFGGVAVATTEPVADYMLQAAGLVDMTPFPFQADVMNGTDPSAQNAELQKSLFTGHKVKVFLYNQQVTDSLTESYINLARANGIPVVGVYETMPTPGCHYQSFTYPNAPD